MVLAECAGVAALAVFYQKCPMLYNTITVSLLVAFASKLVTPHVQHYQFGIVYFVLDFFDTDNWSLKLHHLLAIVLSVCTINDMDSPISNAVRDVGGMIELSSLLLNATKLFPKTDWIKVAFAATFFYTRIYKFYFFFPEHFQDAGEYFHVMFTCSVTLYALQIYWGGLILRKMVKFLENPRINYVCNQLCGTTSFLAVFADVVSSASNPLSLFLHFVFALSSSLHHADKANVLFYIANAFMMHGVMAYRAYRLLPFQVFCWSSLLHITTFEIRVTFKHQLEWLSSVAYLFDYVMIGLLTQTPFDLFWLLTAQTLITVMSQHTQCLRDMTGFICFANSVVSIYTFNQIFLACGV